MFTDTNCNNVVNKLFALMMNSHFEEINHLTQVRKIILATLRYN